MPEFAKIITPVILAGGKNTRFGGEDKAFVLFRGRPMIEIIIDRLGEIFQYTIIVTNSKKSYERPEKRYSQSENLILAGDIFTGRGPLGGIHSAMTICKTPYIFVFSCDMPNIDIDIIKLQLEHFGKLRSAEALIPRINNRIEPLHAIYSKALTGRLEEFMSTSADYSIRAFLPEINTEYIDLQVDEKVKEAFLNVNAPSDLH